MQINGIGAHREILLQARKDVNPTDITQKGIQEAKKLSAQYGSSRKIVAFGDHAIAFEEGVFSDLEAKFGKAKALDDGIFALSKEGSNYIANWHSTVLNDLGYAAADKDGDGIITNHEALGINTLVDFDRTGHVYLRKPRKGELPDDDKALKTVQDQFNRVIGDDKNKDGVITTSEVRQGETQIDIDAERKLAMLARGQNPDGTMILPPKEDSWIDPPEIATSDETKHGVADIHRKLSKLEMQIKELRGQGVDDNDPKLKELLAAEKAMLAELKQSGEHQAVDVKA